jgi:PAS domain S-box-containing protein
MASLSRKAGICLAVKYCLVTPLHSLTAKTREIPRLLIFSLALVAPGVVAQTPVETPRTIRVVMDSAYAPYSFQSDEGKLQGILIDQWQAWEKKTGIKVEIHSMDWNEALRRMRAGEFDVIDSIFETADRQAYFDFTPAYATIEASIYFRKDISGIIDLASLKRFQVGVKAGDQHIDQLKANGVTNVILFPSNDAIIAAAKQQKINVFVLDDPSALYLLNKMGIEDEFRHSAPVFRDELRRAVRKGDAATLRIVSDGFAAIDPGELKQIDEKWFGRTINRYGRFLTYAGYAAAVAILVIAGLAAWNRTLRKKILQRTAALAESEQRFRQIAENSREVFWMSTTDVSSELFSVLYISPAYEDVWGRTCESLYRDPHSFIDAIHPEDRGSVVDVIDRAGEKGFEVEYRVVRPDGTLRWIQDRGFPIKDESGRFYRFAGIARDVTEHKQAEEAVRRSEDRIQLIIDTIPTMAWSLRPDGELDFVNQRWLDYTGLSFEGAIEEPTRTVHPEDLSRVMEKWLVVKATSEAYEDEMRLQRADGEYRWFLVRIAPLLDEQGNLLKGYGVAIDIEERKQAEDALRRSEDRLRLVIDTIPTMAWSLQTDGAIDFVNQRWMDYTGLSLEEAIAEPTRSMHPEDLPGAMAEWGANMAAEEPFEGEIRLRRADGEYRWFLVRTDPLRDEQGILIKWYGASIDIEDRRQAEEKLRRSEIQLAEAQRMAHVGSFEWDLRSNAVTWSDELYRIFGLQPGEINVAGDAMSFIHPEDRNLVLTIAETAVKNKEPYSSYYRIVRPGGDVRIVYSHGLIVSDEQGEPIRVFGATQDVTKRKQAEEALQEAEQKYRDIFENAGEGIFQSTPQGRYIAANPALARMYGFASPDELIQSRQDISRQVYVDPNRREEFKLQIEEQGAVRGFEHEVFRKDGSRLWISVNARAVRDEKGAIQYYEGTVQDIAERKAAEENLKATSKQLRALSARLQSAREEEGTRIAREIHDELGSALTSLKWDLEEMDKMLSTSIDQSEHAALRNKLQAPMKLADTAISAIRRIASELRPSILDDLGLVAAIEWQAEQFQSRTGIVCQCDCSLEKVELTEQQSTAFFRILQEALTNVLRHAQATKVNIKIKKEKGYFTLSVSDNGKGISESEKSEQQSLGILGMRERAYLIGGEVSITSAEGQGTVVTLRVPIVGREMVRRMTR